MVWRVIRLSFSVFQIYRSPHSCLNLFWSGFYQVVLLDNKPSSQFTVTFSIHTPPLKRVYELASNDKVDSLFIIEASHRSHLQQQQHLFIPSCDHHAIVPQSLSVHCFLPPPPPGRAFFLAEGAAEAGHQVESNRWGIAPSHH